MFWSLFCQGLCKPSALHTYFEENLPMATSGQASLANSACSVLLYAKFFCVCQKILRHMPLCTSFSPWPSRSLSLVFVLKYRRVLCIKLNVTIPS